MFYGLEEIFPPFSDMSRCGNRKFRWQNAKSSNIYAWLVGAVRETARMQEMDCVYFALMTRPAFRCNILGSPHPRPPLYRVEHFLVPLPQ